MTSRYRIITLTAVLVLSVISPAAAASTGVGAQTDNGILIDFDGDTVTVANGSSQVIEGSADLATGETIEIRIQSTDDTEPQFIMAKTATVDENGRWAAVFDFSDQPAGGSFNLTVSSRTGNVSTNATGEIVPCDGDCADPKPEPTEVVSIDAVNDTVTVANGTTQVITGMAAQPTGTEIVVRIHSTGDTQPRFLKSSTAVVTENGMWALAFDFSTQPAGGTFSVKASTEDGAHSATAEGEIVPCGESCADTPPTDTPTPIPEQTATATPSENGSAADQAITLQESAVDTVRGDTAAIELRFDGADAAVVVVGSDAVGYEIEAVVEDADGDGSATLYVDTALAGRDGQTVSTASGDEVSVRSETALDAALDAGEYEVSAFPTSREDADPTTGTLFVSEAAAGETDASTPTVTATETPAEEDDMTGLLVSAVIVLGGGAVALVLIRR